MNTPKDLLTRARRQRRAVSPSPAPQAPVPAPKLAAPDEPRQAAPQPAGHALYRALMRSHDRMGTRHLNGPG